MSTDRSVAAGLAVVYVVLGSVYLGLSVLVDARVPVLLGSGVRYIVAGLFMFAIVRARNGPLERIRWRTWVGSTIAGVLLFGSGSLVMGAEQHLSSGLVSVLAATTPLLLVLLRLAGRQHVSAVDLCAVLAGLIGVGLVAGGIKLTWDNLGAIGLCLGSAFLFALGLLIVDRLRLPGNALVSASSQILSAGIFLLVAGTCSGEWADVHNVHLSVKLVLAFIYLVVVCTAIGNATISLLLTKTTPSRVATLAYVNPVVALALGFFLAGETISAVAIAGIVTVIASTVVIVSTGLRSRRAEESTAGANGAL